MVGPTPDPEAERRQRTQLRVGFVLMVTLSGTMVAFANGASLPVVAAATVGGLAVGLLMVWYLSRIAPW